MGRQNQRNARDEAPSNNNGEKKRPWGNVYAVTPGGPDADRDDWLPLGAVWENSDGSLSATLKVEPLAWRDIRTERRIVVQRRRDDR
jgi:hypothetical protein